MNRPCVAQPSTVCGQAAREPPWLNMSSLPSPSQCSSTSPGERHRHYHHYRHQLTGPFWLIILFKRETPTNSDFLKNVLFLYFDTLTFVQCPGQYLSPLEAWLLNWSPKHISTCSFTSSWLVSPIYWTNIQVDSFWHFKWSRIISPCRHPFLKGTSCFLKINSWTPKMHNNRLKPTRKGTQNWFINGLVANTVNNPFKMDVEPWFGCDWVWERIDLWVMGWGIEEHLQS